MTRKSATKEKDQFEHAKQNAAGWPSSIKEMLAALDATDRTDKEGSREWDRKRDEADQAIHESVLSIQIRSDWYNPGTSPTDLADMAGEYCILLSTGGPALRIIGSLDRGEAETAEMQIQDWGLPWTRYNAPEATLLAFAQRFYFGD